LYSGFSHRPGGNNLIISVDSFRPQNNRISKRLKKQKDPDIYHSVLEVQEDEAIE